MPDSWIQQHIGAEAIIRREFRNNLANDLQSQWRERRTVAVRPEAHLARNRWRVAAWVAAAAAILVGLIVVLDQPSADSPPVDSTPNTSSPSDVPATVMSTTPESSTPLSVSTFVVSDEIGLPLDGEVVWLASIGAGPNQVGLGECEGCGPWSPIPFGDTIVLLDTWNGRWLSVHSDKTTTVDALEPGTVSAGQPLLAPDGLIYAPFRLDNAPGPDGTPTWVLRGFDPEHLDAAVAEIAIQGAMYTTTEVVADQLVVNGSSVKQLAEGDPAVVEVERDTVTIDTDAGRSEWTFPADWGPSLEGVLADTSVVLRSSDARITVLRADGTATTQRTSGINYGNNGAITIEDHDIVQIELIDNTWQIIRYPLPGSEPQSSNDAFAVIDVSPSLIPIPELAQCTPGDDCPSLAYAPDGSVVSYDEVEHAIHVGQRGNTPPQTIAIQSPVPAAGYIVAIGPDDVAYLAVRNASEGDPIGDLIAVPISGPSAGVVIASAAKVVDLTGDSSLVATRSGLVGVGCCGSFPVLPEPAREPALRWIDQAQMPVELGSPTFSMERSDNAYTFVRTNVDGDRAVWTISADEAFGMQGIPQAAIRADGSVIITWWNVPDGGRRLLRLRADGQIDEIKVPATISVFALSPFGAAIVYDGSMYHTWQLPEFTSLTDVTSEVVARVGSKPFATSDDLIDQLLDDLSRPDGCEVAPSAAVVGQSEVPVLQVTIAARYGCDEGGGLDIVLSMTQDSSGSWVVDEARQRQLCLRGTSDDLCV